MEIRQHSIASTQHGFLHGASRPVHLLSAADAALRTTLGASIRAPQCDGEVAGPRLREAVRTLCDEAHRDGAHAEDVLIAVKKAWAALPELTAWPGDYHRGEVLRHFITVCIEEFYAGHPAPSGGGA